MSTADFLRWMYPDDGWGLSDAPGWIEVRALPAAGGSPRQLFRPLPLPDVFDFTKLALLNADHHILLRVATSSAPASRAADLRFLPALWVDVDDARALPADLPPPSVCVASGRGRHYYWLLAPAVHLDEPACAAMARRLLQAMARACGGDAQATDLARCLRLPGFFNRKPQYAAKPPLCRLLWAESTRRYVFMQLWRAFEDYLPLPAVRVLRPLPPLTPAAASARLPRAAQAYLEAGAPEGQRNAALFRAACALRAAGWAQGEAERALTPRALSDGLDARETATAIRSAYRYASSPALPAWFRVVAASEDALFARSAG
jgi:hypothetical protein